MSTLPLPPGLRWLRIVCRLGQLVHDGTDLDDNPDLLPNTGRVVIKANPRRIRILEPDGRWRMISIADREYNIRSDGELVDLNGNIGVKIPDPASPLIDPTPYTATFAVAPTAGGAWSVDITGDGLPDVIDLAAHASTAPIPPSAVPSLESRLASVEGILAAGGGGALAGMPVFETRAEAEAWEADNPGVPALWLDGGGALIQVTAAEPTWTDDATAGGGSWSTPTITGVTYSPASGTATAGQSVTVTATAQDGYTLSGTASWTHTFPMAAATAVTATAPTRDDTANTYTIPTSTGVEYLVDGAVKAAGTYPVGDVDQTVSVTARALPGYALTGTSSWSLAFTKTPVATVPSGAYGVAVLADSPHLYLPLDDAAGTTSPRVLGSLAEYNNSFTVGSGGATFGAPGLGDGATSVSLPGGETSKLYQTQARFAKEASLVHGAIPGTTRACFQVLAQPTSSTAPAAASYPMLGGTGASIIHVKPNGTLQVTWGTGAGAATVTSAAGVVNFGSRYLITGRWDGTTLTAYVNGSAVGSAPLASISGDQRIAIGNTAVGTGYGPAGRFAGVAIWVGTTDASIPTPARILAYAQAAGLA